MARPFPPTASASATTESSSSFERDETAIVAPSRAISSAIARPMPRPPPVTSATSPSSRPTTYPPATPSGPLEADGFVRVGARVVFGLGIDHEFDRVFPAGDVAEDLDLVSASGAKREVAPF